MHRQFLECQITYSVGYAWQPDTLYSICKTPWSYCWLKFKLAFKTQRWDWNVTYHEEGICKNTNGKIRRRRLESTKGLPVTPSGEWPSPEQSEQLAVWPIKRAVNGKRSWRGKINIESSNKTDTERHALVAVGGWCLCDTFTPRQGGWGCFDRSLIDVNDIPPMAVAFLIPHPGGVRGLRINVKQHIFSQAVKRCQVLAPMALASLAQSQLRLRSQQRVPQPGPTAMCFGSQCGYQSGCAPRDDASRAPDGSNIWECGHKPSTVLWTGLFICVA